MKVYIVKAPQGEYEDYREPIVKVFADKGKAEEYVKIENAKFCIENYLKDNNMTFAEMRKNRLKEIQQK